MAAHCLTQGVPVRKHILNLSNLRLGGFQAKFLGKIGLAAVVGVAACFGILKWQDYSANFIGRISLLPGTNACWHYPKLLSAI